MKRLLLLLLFTAACAPVPGARAGLPHSLMTEDRGDVSGVWRQVSGNGRSVARGYLLTIDTSIGTFAVQKGCAATGGVLAMAENGTYRLQHYTSGFAAEGCPPWRAVPELTPFDAAEVRLVRNGKRLSASSSAGSADFVRVTRG